MDRAKLVGVWAVIALVGFLIGAFMFAPNRQRSQPNYVPATYLAMPNGMITLQGAEGERLVLPVRVADTSNARLVGFRDLGEAAILNEFLLYAQSREVAARSGYSVERVRVPLEIAVIGGDGTVLSIATSSPDQTRVTIPEPHRWALAAKQGTFAHYGIEPGMTLDIESIRKVNL